MMGINQNWGLRRFSYHHQVQVVGCFWLFFNSSLSLSLFSFIAAQSCRSFSFSLHTHFDELVLPPLPSSFSSYHCFTVAFFLSLPHFMVAVFLLLLLISSFFFFLLTSPLLLSLSFHHHISLPLVLEFLLFLSQILLLFVDHQMNSSFKNKERG